MEEKMKKEYDGVTGPDSDQLPPGVTPSATTCSETNAPRQALSYSAANVKK